MKTSLSLIARLCGALVLATASVACSGVGGSGDAPAPATPATPAPAPASRPPVAAAPASGLMDQLKAEIGDAACDTASQCKTVAVGSKACGGPESYMAYSTKRSDSAKVTRLAAEDAAQRKSANQRSGMISNCMMAVDPGATCSAGRCVTASGVDATR